MFILTMCLRIGKEGGLPFYTSPTFIRCAVGGSIGLTIVALIPSVNEDFFFKLILVLAAYCALPFWMIFGGKKSDAEWDAKNELEKARQLQQKELDEKAALEQKKIDDQLAQEHAIYAAPEMSAGDITETARRIAEKLKKG